MAEHFLYLTTKGRTTGAARQIEIWFVALRGRHYMVSERREESGWVKNIQHDPAVSFSVGTRSEPTEGVPVTAARGRIVRAEEEPELAREVRALMDAKYRWSDGLIVELSPV